MCGICGIHDPFHRLSPHTAQSAVKVMMQELSYRGPDEQGTYSDQARGIHMGHVRLSIIDLNSGQQPMMSTDHRYHIVFNGEIYNYHTERNSLAAQGYSFRTESDTEVILALYARYGAKAWSRLCGQFALALWDQAEEQLWLVRDRMGEKPLVYAQYQDQWIFASEVKAILRSNLFPKKLDHSVLGVYLLTQHVPAPFTLAEQVKKLPPGHALRITRTGHHLDRYWSPSIWPVTRVPSFIDTVPRFRELFRKSVERCLISDVPIGCFLSGGLDSTSVSQVVTETQPGSLKTFAVFNEENHSQHPDWTHAQTAAHYLGTDHHNVFYNLNELMGKIPTLTAKSDEPFEGPTVLVSLHLSEYTRKHVKVVLTGNGGDELLGGYQDYYRRMFRIQRYWQWFDRLLPESFRQHLANLFPSAWPIAERFPLSGADRRIKTNLSYHQRWMKTLLPNRQEETRLHLKTMLASHGTDLHRDYVRRYLHEDLMVYHHHSITTMADATGMACSLEARNPFLDHELVEFLLSLPPRYLIRPRGPNKYLLIKAMESKLPSSILHRSKEGFSGMTAGQIIRWITTQGRATFRDQLIDSALVKGGYFSRPAVEELWRRYETAPNEQEAIYFQIPLWCITMLSLWHARHIRGTT